VERLPEPQLRQACRRTRSISPIETLQTLATWGTVMPHFTQVRMRAACEAEADKGGGLEATGIASRSSPPRFALWNTVYLGQALDEQRGGGEMISAAGSTSISPAIICGMPRSALLRMAFAPSALAPRSRRSVRLA
jgi:hypothetical protein